MTKNRGSLRKNQPPKSYEESKEKQDPIKIILFLVTFTGLVLTLLGYGYKLGLASRFGWDALDIVYDKTDFIYSSAIPVSLLITKLFSSDWIISTLFSNVITLLSLILIPGFIFLLLRFALSTEARKSGTRKLVANNFENVLDKAVHQDCLLKGLFRIVTTALLAFSLFLATAYGAVIVLITLVVMIPTIGYSQGQKMAMDYIVNPKLCVNHQVHINVAIKDIKPAKGAPKGAKCIKLLRNEKELVRGRYIAESKDRIFMYVKEQRIDQGNAKITVRVPKSYPKRNIVIEQVGTEDVALNASN